MSTTEYTPPYDDDVLDSELADAKGRPQVTHPDAKLTGYPAEWRARIEWEIARARDLGKTPPAVPTTEDEWAALYRDLPRPVYAAWYVLTGKRPPNA